MAWTNWLERLGRLFPEKVIEKLDAVLEHAGSRWNAETFLGLSAILTVLYFIVGIIIYAAFPVGAQTPFVKMAKELTQHYIGFWAFIIYSIGLITLYFIIVTTVYSYYTLKAEMRRNAIEEVVPDFLALVSSNLRGGMTLEQALWQAAKPEFGILSQEVKASMKEAFAGTPIEDALDGLSKKFNSPLFSRSLIILKESIKSGGEVAVVLEKTAEEVRSVTIAKREIRSMLLIYVIFLVFASAIGVPLLMAVSEKMVATLQQSFFAEATGAAVSSFIGFSISTPPFTAQEFHWFSIIMIFITVFITSFIVSVAYTGTKRQAFKFFPFMLITAYIVYYLSLGSVQYILINLV